MSWRSECSRWGVPTAPRKYLVVTMFAALTDQKSGNSTPRCSKLTEPSRQFVITTSRRSQVTSAYGCTPAVVNTRPIESRWPGAPVAPEPLLLTEPRTVSVMTAQLLRQFDRRCRSVMATTARRGSCGLGWGASGAAPPWVMSRLVAESSAADRELGHQWRRRVDVRRRDRAGGVVGTECGDLGFEVREGVEGAVDAGETEVGHLVELPQRSQNGQPNLVRRDFGAAAGADGVLHPLRQQREGIFLGRSALAGLAHASEDLGPAERFGRPTPLDHGQAGGLHGGEPTPAVGARTPPADRLTVVGLPAVDEPRISLPAERAPHQTSLRFQASAARRTPGTEGMSDEVPVLPAGRFAGRRQPGGRRRSGDPPAACVRQLRASVHHHGVRQPDRGQAEWGDRTVQPGQGPRWRAQGLPGPTGRGRCPRAAGATGGGRHPRPRQRRSRGGRGWAGHSGTAAGARPGAATGGRVRGQRRMTPRLAATSPRAAPHHLRPNPTHSFPAWPWSPSPTDTADRTDEGAGQS